MQAGTGSYAPRRIASQRNCRPLVFSDPSLRNAIPQADTDDPRLVHPHAEQPGTLSVFGRLVGVTPAGDLVGVRIACGSGAAGSAAWSG